MRYLAFVIVVAGGLLSCKPVEPSVNKNVKIYRDQWGVPHIHGKTDEDVAYGLAWASCEDDFVTIQEQMLAIKGHLGEVKGKDGIIVDFAIKYMGLLDFARDNYRQLLSPKVIAIIESYLSGVNSFAVLNRDQVISKQIFPLNTEDVVAGYMLGLVEISGAGMDLQKIMNGTIVKEVNSNFPKGSNAIAVSSRKTETGETFLAINSHQPMEGWYSWYEVHLVSDEGLNILGGTFPGGMTVFHGVNENIGWAHTVNNADFSDIYKLEMHPDKKLHYRIDDRWEKLGKKHFWAWLKVWGKLKIPIRRTIYTSLFGRTFKTDNGFFAWRFVAGEAANAIEQWYRMNRASNLTEFQDALKIQGIPCTNIVYADRDDNIFYISNGKLPLRNSENNWLEVLPGNSSDLLWSDYWPIDSLPQVLNPASGFVFNTNNTPYSSSEPSDNPQFSVNHKSMGYQPAKNENNRSLRFLQLIATEEQLSYDEFKRIKFDRQYPDSLSQPSITNLELILNLDSSVYPDINEEIKALDNWNRRTDASNKNAALFILAREALTELVKSTTTSGEMSFVTDDQCAEAIRRASAMLKQNYGSIQVPLGEIQRHRRGTVDLPLGGGPDVLAAIYSDEDLDGKFRASAGESYILMARFDRENGPTLESIHAYGSSTDPSSPHYTDQMSMFSEQKLKKMPFTLNEIQDIAVNSYHPLIYCP